MSETSPHHPAKAGKISRWFHEICNFWAGWVIRLRWPILILTAGLSYLAFDYSRNNLNVQTKVEELISEELDFRQDYIAYEEAFPESLRSLLVVVEANTPEFADEAAQILQERLQADPLFEYARLPGMHPFLQRNGLLFRSEEKLQDLTDDLAEAQPFLASLDNDPSLRGLFDLFEDALDEWKEEDAERFEKLTVRLNAVLLAEGAGEREHLSWRALMQDDELEAADFLRFLFVKPVEDYSRLFPAAEGMERIREIVAEMDLGDDHGVRVRITGAPAMGQEELKGLMSGTTQAGIASAILVCIALYAGLRRTSMALATLLTQVVGLVLTAGFAFLVVGRLNLISIAFGVLYIGMGVDYAIHLCLRYRELLLQGADKAAALQGAVADIGPSLGLCSITTALGFYAFIPTAYVGVSELGLISGTSMFISMFVSLTVLPALLYVLSSGTVNPNPPLPTAKLTLPITSLIKRHEPGIRISAIALAVMAVIAVTQVDFEYHPTQLRDPSTESVATYLELSETEGLHPARINILADSLEEAERLSEALKDLPTVDQVVSLADFVPEEQEQKRFLIDDLELILGPIFYDISSEEPPTTAEQIAALESFLSELESRPEVAQQTSFQVLGRELGRVVERLKSLPEEEASLYLADLQDRILGTFHLAFAQLENSLGATPFELGELPREIYDNWANPEGIYRVEVSPAGDIRDDRELKAFVSQVRAVAPRATSGPVMVLESGNAVIQSFQQAFAMAIAAISLLLLFVMRNLRDTLLVLFPLLLAGLLIGMATVIFDVPFNFANIIALPLMLGLGVDNGIHLMHRMRFENTFNTTILGTSTARGILFSGLTTICSFGTLAFLSHRGTANMGQLLTLGVMLSMVCTLIILPAFANWMHQRLDRVRKA